MHIESVHTNKAYFCPQLWNVHTEGTHAQAAHQYLWLNACTYDWMYVHTVERMQRTEHCLLLTTALVPMRSACALSDQITVTAKYKTQHNNWQSINWWLRVPSDQERPLRWENHPAGDWVICISMVPNASTSSVHPRLCAGCVHLCYSSLVGCHTTVPSRSWDRLLRHSWSHRVTC